MMDYTELDIPDCDDRMGSADMGISSDDIDDIAEGPGICGEGNTLEDSDVTEAEDLIEEDIPEDVQEEPDWKRTSLRPSEEDLVQEMGDSGELDIPKEDPELADPEHAEIHLPEASGEFSGERGNSEFRPSSEEAIQLMGEYGRDSVEYRDGYPVFLPFTTHKSPWGDLECQVEIGHMTDQRENPSWEFGDRPRGSGHDPSYDLGNFAQADNSLLERVHETQPDATVQDVVAFRKENQLTWHECADGKTMQLVPTVIHDACRHSGGVSEMKYRMAWGDIERPY